MRILFLFRNFFSQQSTQACTSRTMYSSTQRWRWSVALSVTREPGHAASRWHLQPIIDNIIHIIWHGTSRFALCQITPTASPLAPRRRHRSSICRVGAPAHRIISAPHPHSHQGGEAVMGVDGHGLGGLGGARAEGTTNDPDAPRPRLFTKRFTAVAPLPHSSSSTSTATPALVIHASAARFIPHVHPHAHPHGHAHILCRPLIIAP